MSCRVRLCSSFELSPSTAGSRRQIVGRKGSEGGYPSLQDPTHFVLECGSLALLVTLIDAAGQAVEAGVGRKEGEKVLVFLQMHFTPKAHLGEKYSVRFLSAEAIDAPDTLN